MALALHRTAGVEFPAYVQNFALGGSDPALDELIGAMEIEKTDTGQPRVDHGVGRIAGQA